MFNTANPTPNLTLALHRQQQLLEALAHALVAAPNVEPQTAAQLAELTALTTTISQTLHESCDRLNTVSDAFTAFLALLEQADERAVAPSGLWALAQPLQQQLEAACGPVRQMV